MRRRAIEATVLSLVITACGGDPPADSMETAGEGSTSTGAVATSTTGTTGSTDPGPTATSEPGTTAGVTTTDAPSGSTSEASSSGGSSSGTTTEDGSSSSSEASTGDAICTLDEVLDVVSYNFVKVTDVGVDGVTAGYYNSAAGELVFLSGSGAGVRMELDGTLLGDVAVPMMLLGQLDGAVYDPATDTALLIDKGCIVAEVDPVTLAEVSAEQLDVDTLAIESCSGIAMGVDGDLFIASRATDEVVVISRDLMDEVDRFSASGNGIESIDGITAIPGSENFLLTSGAGSYAAILTGSGDVVSPATEIGGGIAPLVGGGELDAPDGLFSVCANGQVWLCRGLTTSCSKFAPEGGGEDVCDCVGMR